MVEIEEGVDSPQLKFLEAIHGEFPEGFIEARLITEGVHRPPVAREWYGSPASFVEDLPRLLRIAEQQNAGVFFGVLCRRAKGGGKVEDVLAGAVAWVDLDFKDYAGGEAEARARLAAFAIQPSIVVRTGHGLHAYWLVEAAIEPAAISALCEGVGEILGGDHVHDAARILRLPGTFNRKDASNPLPVEIETFEPERRCTHAELASHIARTRSTKTGRRKQKPSDEDGPSETPPPDSESEGFTGNAVSERVQALTRNNKKVRDPYFGVGKPAVGRDGKPLDTSSSGYDYSFVAALVREGVEDKQELIDAVLNRPDGHARSKGLQYAERTVAKVLEECGPREADPYADLSITRVRINDSNPPVYEFTALGRQFWLQAAGLAAMKKFGESYLAATHVMPLLPEASEWPFWVNQLLAKAERVEMPPEASTEPALRDAVLNAIEDMAITDEATELGDGKAIDLGDERKAFREISVRKKVREDFPGVGREDVCRVLKDLGYLSGSHRVGERSLRLWSLVASR